jgi:outer membrane protein TolC
MIKSFFRNKNIWLIGILMTCGQLLSAQVSNPLTLDGCIEMAKINYPTIRQFSLIEQAREYSLDNARKAYLPQFTLMGQATYQSDVTQIPVSLPGLNIPVISKDQYRLYGEVSQSITDLFTVRNQQKVIHANADIEIQKTEVELYKLRERINNLFFGILMIDAQIGQVELLKKDIKTGIEKTGVAIANGVALKSAADNLEAELLKVDQRAIELKAARKGYTEMLSLFIGKPVDEQSILQAPAAPEIVHTVNRAELKLFDLQRHAFDAQEELITARNLPRISVFLQGGIGRPALNMLHSDLKGYYIGGLRLAWNFTGFYTYMNEKAMLVNQGKLIDVQRETFTFNTNLQIKQQNAEIIKMKELLESDKAIVALRANVTSTTSNQLALGTATTNDYLVAINAEDQARQNMLLHQIQLLMIGYHLKTITGN